MPQTCGMCDSFITPTVPGLKCSQCGVCYHIKCVDISKGQYDNFKSITGLEWKCHTCRNLVKSNTASPCKCCEIIPQLKLLIDKLSDSVKTLQEQLLEAKNVPADTNYEEIVQEVTDRQIRKSNLIFYGIPEQSSTMPPAGKISKDLDYVKEFLAEFGNMDEPTTTVLKCNRLGKFDPNRSLPRPIRIILDNPDHVLSVLRKVKENRNRIQNSQRFHNVKVSSDKTPKQNAYFRNVKQELQRREAEGESDLQIKFVKGIPRIIKVSNHLKS